MLDVLSCAHSGNYNPLERPIKAASNDSNYSWCTCSEEICTEQLRGYVQWNMNGDGWKGAPQVLSTCTVKPVS